MDIKFPLYKLRQHQNIETTPLGKVKVTSIKGTKILDDKSLSGNFIERRIKMVSKYDKKEIYKLKEEVTLLRQLIKYKTGTVFIDREGKLLKYKKSTKLYKVKCYKIEKAKRINDTTTVIYLNGFEQELIVYGLFKNNTKYASIMYTTWGPLLYDLTTERHDMYRRKI